MFSLIQTSQNRREDLRRFVKSLNGQEDFDFSQLQIIFVDQEHNKDVFDELNIHICLTYIATEHCSLSHARNLALPYVKGKYVGFPDDDCWYEPDTLHRALEVLEMGKYDGVSGKGTNENGIMTSGFPNEARDITISKQCAAISYTIFFRFEPSVLFDENMGVGSKYNLGAGEETDYMLRLIEQFDFHIYYDPNIIVHHPIRSGNHGQEFYLNKAYSYARGEGYLMKKHRFSYLYYLKQFLRPLGGCLFFAFKFNRYRMKKSYLLLKGRIEGALFKVNKLN